MFYPVIAGMPLKHEKCLAAEMCTADNGSHCISQVLKFCDSEVMPNPILIHYQPDEDYQYTTKCDMWSIITTAKKYDLFAPIFWGKNNQVQAPFILVRYQNEQIWPWLEESTIKNILEFVLNRQEYWEQNAILPTVNTLDDLIGSLK